VTNFFLCFLVLSGYNVCDASSKTILSQVRNPNTLETCWVQVGVVSWGYGCGQTYTVDSQIKKFPGFYTNLFSVIDWIYSTIDPGKLLKCRFLFEHLAAFQCKVCERYLTSVCPLTIWIKWITC